VEIPRGDDQIEAFVLSLLRTGSVLSEIVSALAEELPPGAYPGEKPIAVVIEMLCATIATALSSADPRDVRRATELTDRAAARTLEHLRLARGLSQRIHGDAGNRGPTYG
jgi:predicted trehalose synthase